MKNLSPHSPHFNDEKKKARFGLRANSSLIWGVGGFISHFILSKIAISVKTNEKFESPLPPFQWWKKKSAFWFAREFIIDMGGGGGYFSFYSVQDCSSKLLTGSTP